MNFVVFAKVFSTKFGGVVPLARQKRAIRERFLRENHIFHQFVTVFPLKMFSAIQYKLT